jgi:DNA-directed RNA polymerase subunit H (RpoH/RPB5)
MENAVYNTCLEMLEQRGYTNVEQIDEDPMILTVNNKENDKVCVIFSGDIKVKVGRIRQYLGFMDEIKCSHGIIIHNDTTTSMSKKTAEESQDKRIELFSNEDLVFNITKHVLTPKHTRLSKNESKAFKDVYGTKFPCLRIDDPVSRFYCYDKGDVIEIESLDDIITYRIVK